MGSEGSALGGGGGRNVAAHASTSSTVESGSGILSSHMPGGRTSRVGSCSLITGQYITSGQVWARRSYLGGKRCVYS